MLSILIPTYNYQISSLVSKIHQQALNASIDFEIIVIDDFSTNKTCIEANKSVEKLTYLFFFRNEKNLGRTATRNLLAKKANYNILLFLDADVLPKYPDFISRFNLKQNNDFQVVFGGVCYEDIQPDFSKILRWKYGIKRESKSTVEREKSPFNIISQNLLITKSIFLENNTLNLHSYGLDILFSNNLKKNNVSVKHIDNPVVHLGLEDNITFLNKSLEAVKTTFDLEKENLLDINFRPLQKSYRILKKWKLRKLFSFIVSIFKKPIKTNLISRNPSMFLLDLYKLQYYVTLKLNKND